MHQSLTSNEVEKLDKLLRKHEKKLIHRINNLVGNFADADDILSIAFMKAFNGYHNVREKEDISSWLYNVCNSAVSDFFRLKKNDASRITESVADPAWNIEERVVFESSMDELIERLPQNYRMPLLLDQFGDSCAEGAAELNISISTYKNRLYRGRTELRKQMESPYPT
ncbi:MAG: RNA polymerase sigma-70 factor, ECF subfamily [archaeon GW2011_AR6]|nr:MAG: RNA polymerase sigma-70 factor, ECF subfamily [archaeon GW2011_AR6]HIH34445.1 sigma-70 family RNA polymerase sigma factor [Nanoarchaeota archaeon]